MVPLAGVLVSLFLAPESAVQNDLHADVRATHDMAIVPADLFSEGSWMVARVVPSHPAAATPAGTVLEEGAWHRVASIGPPAGDKEGRYSWTRPLSYHKQRFEAADLYSPFSRSGVILCHPRSEAAGSEPFQSVHLVPAAWGSSLPLAPIFAFRRALEAGVLDTKSFTAALDQARGHELAILARVTLRWVSAPPLPGPELL